MCGIKAPNTYWYDYLRGQEAQKFKAEYQKYRGLQIYGDFRIYGDVVMTHSDAREKLMQEKKTFVNFLLTTHPAEQEHIERFARQWPDIRQQ